jgi:hypothetical protein
MDCVANSNNLDLGNRLFRPELAVQPMDMRK